MICSTPLSSSDSAFYAILKHEFCKYKWLLFGFYVKLIEAQEKFHKSPKIYPSQILISPFFVHSPNHISKIIIFLNVLQEDACE